MGLLYAAAGAGPVAARCLRAGPAAAGAGAALRDTAVAGTARAEAAATAGGEVRRTRGLKECAP